MIRTRADSLLANKRSPHLEGLMPPDRSHTAGASATRASCRVMVSRAMSNRAYTCYRYHAGERRHRRGTNNGRGVVRSHLVYHTRRLRLHGFEGAGRARSSVLQSGYVVSLVALTTGGHTIVIKINHNYRGGICHKKSEPTMYPKTHICPYFYTPFLVLITMFPRNRVF